MQVKFIRTKGRAVLNMNYTFGKAMGIVSTTLGAAKDALASEYVSLATRTRAPSLDLSALFAGVKQA